MWKSRTDVKWLWSMIYDSFSFQPHLTLIASPASLLFLPVIIYFILEFHNCSVYTFARTLMHTLTRTQKSKHFSWLPLSFVAILRARLA